MTKLKAYIKPETTVILINTTALLAGSPVTEEDVYLPEKDGDGYDWEYAEDSD